MGYSIADVRQASISGVTPGPTAIVAAPGAGRRIVVLGYYLSLDANGEYLFSSAANALMGSTEVLADSPTGAMSTLGVLHCNPNEALNLTASAAANGWVRYVIARF